MNYYTIFFMLALVGSFLIGRWLGNDGLNMILERIDKNYILHDKIGGT